MFRELTYEELGFVSGGQDKTPPPEEQPTATATTGDGEIIVQADFPDGSDGDYHMTMVLSDIDFDLQRLVVGYSEGGVDLFATADLHPDPNNSQTPPIYGGGVTLDLGNGVSVTAKITSGGHDGTVKWLTLDWDI